MTSATTHRSTGNSQLHSAAMPPFAYYRAALLRFYEIGGCYIAFYM